MRLNCLLKNTEPLPSQLNEQNQVTDMKILSKNRIKFGFSSLLYQSEESSLIPIYTVIVRALDGSAIHLGFAGAICSVSSLTQCMGEILLRRFKSNFRAMRVAVLSGVIISAILTLILLLAVISPILKMICLWAFLFFAFTLAGISGVQNNIETGWIGDLVPKNRLGFFTSMKWFIAAIGYMIFVLIFGQLTSIQPTLPTYAMMFVVVGISHIVAVGILATATDRKPQTANFISGGDSHHERINYRSLQFWCYIWYYTIWVCSRAAFYTFTTAYLLDFFKFGMDKISYIMTLQSVVGMLVLLVMGKISDKWGTRKPLLYISLIIGLAMCLWPLTAWTVLGIFPILVYEVISGVAGYTHAMISTNYGVAIFPAKGRAAYFGFARTFSGICAIATAISCGMCMEFIEKFQFYIGNTLINNYHIFFMGCALFTTSSIIPLLIAGNKPVKPDNSIASMEAADEVY